MRLSLGKLIIGLSLLFLAVAGALGVLMGGLFQLGIDAQVRDVQAKTEKSATLIEQRFEVYLATYKNAPESFNDEQRHRELNLILGLVLAEQRGVEGGFWTESGGFIAYAFPTYQGETPKTDVPEVEKGRLLKVMGSVSEKTKSVNKRFDSQTEALSISAQFTGSHRPVIWTMARAHIESAAAYQKLMAGFIALFVFALISGTVMLWFMRMWSRRLSVLVRTIDLAQGDVLPLLKATGEADLDHLIEALNRMNSRLRESRRELARAERMAALGRMAASVAHEVRNPVGAIRLRAENALVKTDAHRVAALEFALQQIHRLDDLLERLLALTKLESISCSFVELQPWAAKRLEALSEEALQKGIRLLEETEVNAATFDEPAMSRAVENLLRNAIQHTPPQGWVKLLIQRRRKHLLLVVEDSGPGVDETQREAIFEPFVTTRGDGAGLGLNIVRQIVEAHGGIISCTCGKTGARFEILLPWEES